MPRKLIKYTLDPEDEGKSFFFDHVHIPHTHQLSLHQQGSWEITYIITGRGMRVIGDTVEPFSEGEVILIPPNIPHCWSFDENVCDKYGKIENITVAFSEALLTGCETLFAELQPIFCKLRENRNAISFTDQKLIEIQNVLKQMISETAFERVASLIKLIGLTAYTEDSNVVGYSIKEDLKTRRIQDVYLYVMNNYQHPITLDDIAQFAGMEKSAFCVFFKKMTNQSFFIFLTDYRVESSCQMLLKTKKSIAEICLASGFRDVPYFNRVFKKLKKMTPSEYRILNTKAEGAV